MKSPRKPRAPGKPRQRKRVVPPQVVVGGGGAGFGDGEPVHLASLLVAEIRQACALHARAQRWSEDCATLRQELAALSEDPLTELSLEDRLERALDPRPSPETAALQSEIATVEGQAIEAGIAAKAIFTRVTGTIANAIDRAQQFERNLEARVDARRKAAERTRAAYALARDATLAQGLPLTPDNLRANWPNSGCPENSWLYELINEPPISGI